MRISDWSSDVCSSDLSMVTFWPRAVLASVMSMAASCCARINPKHPQERPMNEAQITEKVVALITPYVKNPEALKNISKDTSILGDLGVNSARLEIGRAHV